MSLISTAVIIIGITIILSLIALSIRIVRPTHRGLVERFGKYNRLAQPGLTFIIPFVEKMVYVNITEQMVDVDPQMVITNDKLNAEVDAVVYYKIRENEKDVKASQYNVDNHRRQLTSLARTTLRAVIGKMTLTDANEKRNKINTEVEYVLEKETNSYGVHVLRVEIQKIEPPQDVQVAMNEVVKAEQEKIAAKDLATAEETKADGFKRAEIKKAEGIKQSKILQADGESAAIKKVADAHAEEIKLVNDSICKHFKDKAIDYKKLETVEKALKNGTKIIIDSNKPIMNVLSEVAGVTPVPFTNEGTK